MHVTASIIEQLRVQTTNVSRRTKIPPQNPEAAAAGVKRSEGKDDGSEDEGGGDGDDGKAGADEKVESFVDIAERVPLLRGQLKRYYKGVNLDNLFAEPKGERSSMDPWAF